MRLISRKEIVMWQLYGVSFETGFLSSPGLRRDRHIELQRLQPKRVESAPVPKHGISADLARILENLSSSANIFGAVEC